ncbi:MAG TPA: hypothetical protein VIU40_11570 [Geobacteraceae bacterium]
MLQEHGEVLSALDQMAGIAQSALGIVDSEMMAVGIVQVMTGYTGNFAVFQLHPHGEQTFEGCIHLFFSNRRVELQDRVRTAKIALHRAGTGATGNETVVAHEAVFGSALGLDIIAMVGNDLGSRTAEQENGKNDRHEQHAEKDGSSHTSPWLPPRPWLSMPGQRL